jgi:hypothetical protein
LPELFRKGGKPSNAKTRFQNLGIDLIKNSRAIDLDYIEVVIFDEVLYNKLTTSF